jgi:hypothetical protein
MLTVLVITGVSITFQPPLAPRASPTDIGATSVVDVPMATHVLVVQPTDVSGSEMLVDGTPETRGIGATAAVPHDANTSAAIVLATATRAHERTLADTRLMASLSSVRLLSLR